MDHSSTCVGVLTGIESGVVPVSRQDDSTIGIDCSATDDMAVNTVVAIDETTEEVNVPELDEDTTSDLPSSR